METKPTRKAFVLLSGGLDSTTLLHYARTEFLDVEAVSVFYDQRHDKELSYASRTCASFNLRHSVLELKNILGGSMLTDKAQQIPDVHYSDIVGVSPTYVPFRNGLFLSLITAHAQKWVNDGQKDVERREAYIYFGAHAEDAQDWAYPDCTPEFIGAMANAIYIGSYSTIRLKTPLMWLKKHEIVSLGAMLDVDFSETWSCYAGGEVHCGACPTCHARKEAFSRANVWDPTVYANTPDRSNA